MKRPIQDVAGRPREREVRPDVAGRIILRRTSDLESCCHMFRDSMTTASEEASLIEDFRDFLAGDEDFDSVGRPEPDPIFRERLRRKVWRQFVVSQLGSTGGNIH